MRNRVPAKSHITQNMTSIIPSTTKHTNQNYKILAISKFINSTHTNTTAKNVVLSATPYTNLYQLLSTIPKSTSNCSALNTTHGSLSKLTISANQQKKRAQNDNIYYKKNTPTNSHNNVLNESSYEKAHRLDDRNSYMEIPISEGKENKIKIQNRLSTMQQHTYDIELNCKVSEWSTTMTPLSRNIRNHESFKPVLLTKYSNQFFKTQSKCTIQTNASYSKMDIDSYRTSNSYKVKEMIRKKCSTHIGQIS